MCVLFSDMEAGAVSFHDRDKVRKVKERRESWFLKYNLVGWLGECGEK